MRLGPSASPWWVLSRLRSAWQAGTERTSQPCFEKSACTPKRRQARLKTNARISESGHFETKSDAYRCASIGLVLLQELTFLGLGKQGLRGRLVHLFAAAPAIVVQL